MPVNTTQLLKDSQLIVDVFDNSVARQAVKDYASQFKIPCLHAGLSASYAEVIWNQVYRVPSDINDDICDYPLARNLVMLTVAVACEAVISFIAKAQRRNFLPGFGLNRTVLTIPLLSAQLVWLCVQ